MTRFLSILFAICLWPTGQNLQAQIFDPVKWSIECTDVQDGIITITAHAVIDEGWNIYSKDVGDGGPIPTSIVIESEHKQSGDITEASPKKVTEYDVNFEMDLIKLKKTATYTLKADLSSADGPVTGFLEYMVCDKSRCLPPTTVDFSLSAKDCSGTGDVRKTIEPEENVTELAITETNYAEERLDPAPSEEESLTSNPTTTSASRDVTDNTEEDGGFTISLPDEGEEETVDNNNQILQPVVWQKSIIKKKDNTFEITFTADIADGWAIYSKDIDEDAGPNPTLLSIDENPQVSWNGTWSETSSDKKKSFDPIFEADITKLKKDATLKTIVESKDGTSPISGYLEYMTCDDAKCIFPAPLEFSIDPSKGTFITGNSDNKSVTETTGAQGPVPHITDDKLSPIGNCRSENRAEISSSNIWKIFGLGFVGGLLALLTPCVFPMIPLTVSFFTKGGKAGSKGIRDAVTYGFFILLAYLLVSVPFHLLDNINSNILNDISTNVWLNLFFFVMLVVFAFSFFGFFEITLPSSWTNKTAQAEGKGGLFGIFAMALTLTLVSFSCTGPILGSLLAGALSNEGGAWQLTSGFAGFGLALALPFGLFAAFPSFMQALPKSGGWLDVTKKILGFLELAFAFKFLSNADLVKHWGLLKIEPFLLIWFVVFAGLALYCFGILRLPHDAPRKAKKPFGRLAVGALATVIALYTLTGFRFDADKGTFKSLTWGPFSGFPPPAAYSWIYPSDCPHSLDCFKDFDAGMRYAQENNKPVLLDFTGYACVNCRKMEEQVWPEQEVFDQIKDDYVLISLYAVSYTHLTLPTNREV